MAYVLRKQRIAAGLTAAELARSVGMSGSKISRFETCESGIYLDDLEKLIDFYQLSKQRRVELLDIARNAEQRGWLRLHHAGFPEDWQTWADFEDEASALLNYEPLLIPGLLQTPEYTKAIINATGRGISEGRVDALVASRRARQGIVDRSNPLDLHVVIDEAALRRQVEPDGVMARQARHLAEVAAKPNVTVQVLTQDAGLHEGLNGPFVILKYDDEPSLVLLENKVASLFLDEDEHIQVYADVWKELADSALPPERTVEFLCALV